MSLDLLLATASDTPPAWRALKAWASEHGHFTVDETGEESGALRYENPLSGVYFTLFRRRGALPLPGAMRSAELGFTVGVRRPLFFALEALSALGDLCDSFGLEVVDLGQAAPNTSTFDSATLLARWREENASELANHSQRMPRMSTSAALAFWRYRCLFSNLARGLPRHVVPPLEVVTPDGERALRQTVLGRPAPLLLAPADIYAVRREEEVVFLPAAQVHALLAPALRPLEALLTGDDEALDADSIKGLRAVAPEALLDDGLLEAWNALHDEAPTCYTQHELSGLHVDAFVDAAEDEALTVSASEEPR